MMMCIESKYFPLNRIFLLALGLWPFYQPYFVRFQTILCSGILTSCVIFLLIIFLTAECTLYLVTKNLTLLTICTMFIIQYNSFWINNDIIKCLIKQLHEICNKLKDENEINIMKEYGNSIKRSTAVTILFTISSMIICISMQILSLILDMVLHKNESNSHQMIYFVMPENFIDTERYYYIILFYVDVVISIGGVTLTATGTMIRGYLIYVCGMFKIASYRIEQAFAIKVLDNIITINDVMIDKEIICAVDIHRKAVKYSKFLQSNFEGYFILLMAVNVICLSLNLFAISRSMSLGNEDEFLYHFLIALAVVLHMFLNNYIGQQVMDHNSNIYITAYDVQWYVAPVHTQKLILFILQRSGKAVTLNLGIFTESLESFATLLKASMCYFTFMCSMQ